MAKSYARFYLDKPLPHSRAEGTPKHYNQGFSGSFKSEFDYSERTQEKRLNKRSSNYDEWKRQKVRDRVTDRQREEGERDVIGAVSSSWLTSLGYNMAASEAVATFKGTSGEFYYKMSYDKFLEWYNSPSKGRWLHDHPGIMGNYTMRSGRGAESMSGRMDKFHKKNTLKPRGKLNKYLSKWR